MRGAYQRFLSAFLILGGLGAPSLASAEEVKAEIGIQLESEKTWVTEQVSVSLYTSKGKSLATCTSGKTVDVVKGWVQFSCVLDAHVDPYDVVWVELVSEEIFEVAKSDYLGDGVSELLSDAEWSVGLLAIDLGDEEPDWREDGLDPWLSAALPDDEGTWGL